MEQGNFNLAKILTDAFSPEKNTRESVKNLIEKLSKDNFAELLFELSKILSNEKESIN
jgi:hypothetical protein